jgi:TRAP transporter 4TM/12TM fusion protein
MEKKQPPIVEGLKEPDDQKERARKLSGPLGTICRFLAIGLPIYSFLYIMDLLTPVGLFIYEGTHNAIFLAVVLTLIFLTVPATKSAPRNRVPWYDFVFIAMSLAGVLYVAVSYEQLLALAGSRVTLTQQILGLLTIFVLLEAVRRTMGWMLIIVALFFLIHAKFTYLFPYPFHGANFSWARVLGYIYLPNQGIFGMILGIAASMVVSFLTFGAFLEVSGAGQGFIKLSLALLGRFRGGAAKVAILGSALFGTITGSAIGEVGVIGSLSIPLMKRMGYESTFAAGVEAASACGGIITPPVMGVVAFVMADLTGITYGRICLAAILPALLYFLSIYCQLDLRAARKGLVGLPKEELPSLKEALSECWLLFVPLTVLIILMMVLLKEPTVAIYVAVGVLLLLRLFGRKRLTFSQVITALEKAGTSMLQITPLCALAGIIVGSLTLTGLAITFSGIMVALSGGNLLVLAILTAVAIYIMGMGVSMVASYILLGVLVAPAMGQLGVPVIVAHFFILYISVSMFITPPYAPAAYVAGTIAKADPMRTGFQAMKLAVVAYLVPFISVYQPALLGEGSATEIAVAAVTGIIAVFCLSAGLEGFCFTTFNWLERVIWLAGGFLLFVPTVSVWVLVPGFLLIGIGLMIQRLKLKRRETIPDNEH